MTENQETFGEEPRKGSTAPGLEGEGGQYVDGDYGDAGATGTEREADGIREGLTDRQVNTTAEERGPLHGDRDSDR